MRIGVLLPLACVVSQALSSCSSSSNPASVTTTTKIIDTSGLPTGTIAGHVRLMDSLYRAITTGGAIASLEGTSIQAVTDSNGLYTIANVPAGLYTLDISKPGFGTCKFFNVTAIGPGTTVIPPMVLAKAPVETLHLDSVSGGDTIVQQYFNVMGTSSNYFDQNMVIFADLDSDRQIGESHLFAFEGSRQSGLMLDAQGRTPWLLKSGTRLYLTAAMYNRYSDPSASANSNPTGYYYNPLTDQNCYISVGPRSNVLAVVVK